MNQMTTDDPSKEEVEDFQKTIKIQSQEFAIVDASVIKDLKGIPNLDKAIYVTTKRAEGDGPTFKVTAKYDDATLRQLIIEPAPENEQATSEGIQLRGHDGDSAAKKVSEINRIAGGPVPKTGNRSYRNDGDSAKGNQQTDITVGPAEKLDAKIAQRAGLKTARNTNYGQLQSKNHPEDEMPELLNCFLKHVKAKTITEEYLNNYQYSYETLNLLKQLRQSCIEGIISSNLNLIHESIQILEAYCGPNIIEEAKIIEELLGD